MGGEMEEVFTWPCVYVCSLFGLDFRSLIVHSLYV